MYFAVDKWKALYKAMLLPYKSLESSWGKGPQRPISKEQHKSSER